MVEPPLVPLAPMPALPTYSPDRVDSQSLILNAAHMPKQSRGVPGHCPPTCCRHGHFPPFNRHYAGDLGTFLLPLGLALLVAARNPSRHLLLIGMAAGASVLHAFNHLYDAVAGQATLTHGLVDTGPLLGLGALLTNVYLGLRARSS